MIDLITAQGKHLTVDWIGVSTIDGALRFELVGSTLQAAFSVFSNPEETAKLTRIWDKDRKTFEGFTALKGMDRQFNGNIIVALLEEGIIHAE